MADNSGVEHLRSAHAALLRERALLDAAINATAQALAALSGSPSDAPNPALQALGVAAKIGGARSPFLTRLGQPSVATVPVPVAAKPQPHVPTVRQAIQQVIRQAGEPIKTMDIINGVAGLGVVAQDDTVRSIISKLLNENLITRLSRGVYVDGPTTYAEAPASTGASEASAPNGKEVTDGTAEGMGVQDQARKADDPDTRSGAPVRGQDLVAH